MNSSWNNPQALGIPVNNGEPSKWWSWGLAIAIGVMTIFSVLGSIVTFLIPYDLLLSDWNPEEPGEFPQNGTNEEQGEWNETNEEWRIYENVTHMFDEMQGGLGQGACLLSFVSGIIGMVACTMLIQRNQNGFTMAGIWLLVSTIGQLILTIQYTNMTSGLYPEEQAWIPAVTLASNLGGTIVCNLSLLAVILICATKHKGRMELPESGFHINTSVKKPEEE